MSSTTTEAAPRPLDLTGFCTLDPARPNRVPLVGRPGLKVMHLTLAPGQGLPLHRHPGCQVLLQGLWGVSTVQFEDEAVTLKPQHLLAFSGERLVAPQNRSNEPSALLVTLVHPHAPAEPEGDA